MEQRRKAGQAPAGRRLARLACCELHQNSVYGLTDPRRVTLQCLDTSETELELQLCTLRFFSSGPRSWASVCPSARLHILSSCLLFHILFAPLFRFHSLAPALQTRKSRAIAGGGGGKKPAKWNEASNEDAKNRSATGATSVRKGEKEKGKMKVRKGRSGEGKE